MKADVESYRSIFGFRGLQIEVHSNVRAPLAWLEEFMAPALRHPDQADLQREIRLIVDEHRYTEALRRAKHEPDRWVDCFTKDGAFEQLAEWRDDRGKSFLHSTGSECLIVLDEYAPTIELIAPADRAMVRRCLMRLVRELAMIQAMYRGDLFIHGASVEHRGRAIIITGARRAGKTTMLINALRQSGVRYVANDRVFVEQTGEVRVRGMPTIIAVRGESLGHLPGLELPQWGHPWRHYLTMSECEAGSPLMRPPFQDPPAMNPVQFCRWLGVEMAEGAPLAAVVCPRIDASVDGHSLHRHTPQESAALLGSNLFRSAATGPFAQAFAWGWEGAAPDYQSMQHGCTTLAQRCAVFTCRIGPRAFGSPNVWDAIVAEVFDDSSKGSR